MIEAVYITLLIVGFFLTIYSIEKKSEIFCLIGVVIWLLLMAESLNVSVPYSFGYLDNSTGNFTTVNGLDSYQEWGLSALSLGFVLINLIYAFILRFDWRRKMPWQQ